MTKRPSFKHKFKKSMRRAAKAMGPLVRATGSLHDTPAGRAARHDQAFDLPRIEPQLSHRVEETPDLFRIAGGNDIIDYQWKYGSCTGYAGRKCAKIVAQQLVPVGTDVPDFSAMQIYYEARKMWSLETEDRGAYTADVIYVMKEEGVMFVHYMDDDTSPFEEPPDDSDIPRWFVDDHRQIPTWTSSDRAVAFDAVAEQIELGVPIALSVNSEQLDNYSGKMSVRGDLSTRRPNHAVCGGHIVRSEGKRWLRFANSWSSRWGDRGFGYVPEEAFLRKELVNDLQTFGLKYQFSQAA